MTFRQMYATEKYLDKVRVIFGRTSRFLLYYLKERLRQHDIGGRPVCLVGRWSR